MQGGKCFQIHGHDLPGTFLPNLPRARRSILTRQGDRAVTDDFKRTELALECG